MNRETVERTLRSEKSIAGQDSRHRLAKHLRKPGRWKWGCKGRRGRRGTQRGSVWGLHSEKQGHLRQHSRNKMPFFLPHVEKEEKNKCGFAAVSGSTRNHVSAVPGEHRRPQQEGRCVQGALWLLKQTQEKDPGGRGWGHSGLVVGRSEPSSGSAKASEEGMVTHGEMSRGQWAPPEERQRV